MEGRNFEEELEKLRHSASHVMAYAVKELFPDAKLGIGPPTDEGFYYDFDTEHKFTPQDLINIESKMREIINKNYEFTSRRIAKEEARRFFSGRGEFYKVELLDNITDDEVTLYQCGDFIDLCKGPHVESTGEIKHFKLLSIAGAYWRGDERNRQLQRIYGTAFFTQQELDDYLSRLEEAKKRDHRVLGRSLDLYNIYEQAGPGLIFWHPKAAIMRRIIENIWIREHIKNNYQLVYTPHIAKVDLWKTSGHWDYYRANMYSPIRIEDEEYIIKPMNCPGHILIYKSKLRSWRDLPVKFAEFGTVYRYERSGVLHGLLRVRGFTQDDAHIFCRREQLEKEIKEVLNMTFKLLHLFGFDRYKVYLSTRPESFAGTIDNWESAEKFLMSALEEYKVRYEIDKGAGVFYGPKIDIHIEDNLGRTWQCSTLQVDFNLPQKFNVTFRNKEGKDELVVMLHRALMGSLERFLGILIEHYGGDFPVWLAPVQVRVMTVVEDVEAYAANVYNALIENEIRADKDFSEDRISAKVRNAEIEKIPFMVIIGKKEAEGNVISVRQRHKGIIGNMSVEEFIKLIATYNHPSI
jgi:threonyl-tRNA synthetase